MVVHQASVSIAESLFLCRIVKNWMIALPIAFIVRIPARTPCCFSARVGQQAQTGVICRPSMPWALWEGLERPNKHQLLLLLQGEGDEGSFHDLRSCYIWLSIAEPCWNAQQKGQGRGICQCALGKTSHHLPYFFTRICQPIPDKVSSPWTGSPFPEELLHQSCTLFCQHTLPDLHVQCVEHDSPIVADQEVVAWHLSGLARSRHICLPGYLDETDGVKQLPPPGCLRLLLCGLLSASRSSCRLHLHRDSSHAGDSDSRTSLVCQPSSSSQSST